MTFDLTDKKSLGSADATQITPTIQGKQVPKYRLSVALTDPYDEDARLRLAQVDGAYRLPVSVAPNKISTTSFNSRDAATLAAAATFQGVGEDVSGYGRVGVAFLSDNATDGTLWMEVSHDNVTWASIPRSVANTSTANPVMWNIVEKYFRIKYINGTTEADNLSIQVQYSNNADIILGHPLNETLINEMGATLVRAVMAGQTQGGTYVNVPVSSQGKMQVDLPFTAFGELQVAEKTPQVQIKFPMGVIEDNTQILTNKSGSSVTATNGLCTITCAGAATTRNKVEVFTDSITIINDATKSIQVALYKNPTHLNTPPTLAAVDLANSVMLSAAGSGTRQGGDLLLVFSVTASVSKDIDIKSLGLKMRPTDTWAFVVTKKTGGSNGDVTIAASWLERI